jgi:hypothetical protein
LDWKNIEEIRDFLEWGIGILGGATSYGVEGLAASEWVLAAALFLGFTAAGLGYAAASDLGFLGLAVLLVAVSEDYLGASVTA